MPEHDETKPTEDGEFEREALPEHKTRLERIYREKEAALHMELERTVSRASHCS